ncbi:hypothetical protein GPX89_23920 [Nocardia sp. ET3-3]|uniref:Uncharacterized protein n=1 Tax=Nocardia terrae TaxID=2675851 RepID=A0A7K1V1A6_9NOCA|nr:hypothetical protein [Nocardia terrae]MVU80282.1 hypothetical protein [Nocardia terrae]
MELVELLYDPATAGDDRTHSLIAGIAEQLGIRPIDIAVALSARHPGP